MYKIEVVRQAFSLPPDPIEDLTDLRKLTRTEAKPEAKPRLQISSSDYSPCRSV